VWDATCSNTLCKVQKLIVLDLLHRWSRCRQGREQEERPVLPIPMPTQYTLCPFAVETLGSFGDDALQLVRQLGARLRQSSGDAGEKTWLTQRISVAIQRGKTASILASMPPTAKNFETICHSL
jgi:hypothetical protein